MSDSVLLILIIAASLLYDFVNGFHDAANAIATSIATRALSPRNAIILARTLNFVGGLLHTAVAYTVGKGVVESTVITLPILLAAVVAAVLWGLITWYYGFPSSSTHGLIGGLIGAALFANHFNTGILIESGIRKILLSMLFSPMVGMIGGALLLILMSWLALRFPYKKSAVFFKRLQILSASFMAISHGMNDAQNTMGIITIALLTAGVIGEFHIPLWVRVASAFTIGLGTSVGGWRIIKTMGKKMTNLHEPIDGCAAETAAGAAIITAAMLGAPTSTTHVTTGAIAGTAMAHRIGDVRWRVLRNIVTAWLFTFPAAGLLAMLCYIALKAILHL
jgi:inorganic phosphate transporter, PiT family